MNQKSFANIILVVVIVILVGVVGYFTFKKSPEVAKQIPASTSTPTPVQTPKLLTPAHEPSVNNKSSTPISFSSTSSSITLVSPNGFERLVKGHTYKITWKTTPAFSYPKVDITLVSGYLLQEITPNQNIIVANTGSYEWTIPDVQFTGWVRYLSGDKQEVLNDQTDFRFFIEGYPPVGRAEEGLFDYSDNPFHIVSQ